MKQLFAYALLAITLVACGGAAEQVEEKTCRVKNMSFESYGKKRSFEFFYENERLSKIEVLEEGDGIDETMAYQYNKNGSLQAFLSGAFIAKYVYDDQGRLISILGEESMPTQNFVYNEKGQIVTQLSKRGENLMQYRTFEYDAKGLPQKVVIYRGDSVAVEQCTFKFDDKKNPFQGTGSMINNLEMIYGYPIGEQEHNLLEVQRTYLVASTMRINGKLRKAGERETNKISYEYHESGFPKVLKRIRNGKEMKMHLIFDCL